MTPPWHLPLPAGAQRHRAAQRCPTHNVLPTLPCSTFHSLRSSVKHSEVSSPAESRAQNKPLQHQLLEEGPGVISSQTAVSARVEPSTQSSHPPGLSLGCRWEHTAQLTAVSCPGNCAWRGWVRALLGCTASAEHHQPVELQLHIGSSTAHTSGGGQKTPPSQVSVTARLRSVIPVALSWKSHQQVPICFSHIIREVGDLFSFLPTHGGAG